MSNSPTQRYLDNERQETFLSSLLPTDIQSQSPIVPIPEEIDIDVDIEKQISLLQEASIAGELKVKPELSINPDKQIKEWQLEKEFEGFLESVGKEKEDTSKKIEEEQEKISALENLFDDLMAAKSGKKKKKLLLEPEKIEPIEKVTKVILREPPKPVPGLTKEQIADKYVNLPKEEVYIDENARRIVAEKYKELGNATLHSFLSPEEIESDPDIINKVMSHINEMQIANELDKEKVTCLKSIDTLDKLTREFLNFKHITSMQLGTLGGGGGVQLLDMDDVNVSTKANGYVLKYNSSTERMDFINPNDSFITGLSSDASGNVTITGNLTVEGTQTTVDSTTIEIQNSFKFEGATADAHETNLTTIDPTADRTISLPNATGTIVLKDTTDTLTNKSIDSDNNTITNIVNADIKAAAAIAFSKLADLTVSRLLVSDGSGDVSVSAVTSTEAGYLDGVTSAIQTQLDTKENATKAFAIAQAVALG